MALTIATYCKQVTLLVLCELNSCPIKPIYHSQYVGQIVKPIAFAQKLQSELNWKPFAFKLLLWMQLREE